jgi:hypothetical protein
VPEGRDVVLKVEHDKRACVFIDPGAGRSVFRAGLLLKR